MTCLQRITGCALWDGFVRQASPEVKAQTFVSEVQAPLGDELRAAVAALIDMRWGRAQSEVDRETWGQYEQLCDPDSPSFIVDAPDYYGFFTETLFRGKVASEVD